MCVCVQVCVCKCVCKCVQVCVCASVCVWRGEGIREEELAGMEVKQDFNLLKVNVALMVTFSPFFSSSGVTVIDWTARRERSPAAQAGTCTCDGNAIIILLVYRYI